jgi:predicted small secreted protein
MYKMKKLILAVVVISTMLIVSCETFPSITETIPTTDSTVVDSTSISLDSLSIDSTK